MAGVGGCWRWSPMSLDELLRARTKYTSSGDGSHKKLAGKINE
jgi:hypothetical protein